MDGRTHRDRKITRAGAAMKTPRRRSVPNFLAPPAPTTAIDTALLTTSHGTSVVAVRSR